MMLIPPKTLVNRLAHLEYRLRRGLDRAANRLEDNDPIDVLGLRAGVKVLNLVDRAIGFRAQHRTATKQAFETSTESQLKSPNRQDSRKL